MKLWDVDASRMYAVLSTHPFLSHPRYSVQIEDSG